MRFGQFARLLATLTCFIGLAVAEAEEKTNAISTVVSNVPPSPPGKFNRASSLIGMAVYNEKGDKLGDIKEIVIDLERGAAPYAVMTAGGVFGINEKLLAIPLTAFGRSDQGIAVAAGSDGVNAPRSARDYLVLRAEKESVRQAQGIGDGWPLVHSPSFGAKPFWETPRDRINTTNAASPTSAESNTNAFKALKLQQLP